MLFNSYIEIILFAVVIFSFSIVQSLFGVGLLVFGTPTLLLMGFPFTTALYLLLPSSVLISAIQIFEGKNQIQVKKDFIYYSIPAMLLGIFIISGGYFQWNIKLIIGIVLILITLLKVLKNYNEFLIDKFSKNVKLYMTLMGAIHGISNQGGGLLTFYFSTIYDNKIKVRANIAFCYFVYGMFQLVFLLIFHFSTAVFTGMAFSVISILIYFTVGGKLFNNTSDQLFHRLISFAIVLFGLTLIYTGLF